MKSKALTNTLLVFTVLQLAMVLAGHWIPFVKDTLFAPMGTAISALAGINYVRAARPGWLWAAIGGAVTGGVSALIGIAVSYFLKDVDASTFMIGTSASTVAGLVAGLVTRFFVKP
jgi:hypothetical protein